MDHAAEGELRSALEPVIRTVVGVLHDGFVNRSIPTRTRLHLHRVANADGSVGMAHEEETIIDLRYMQTPVIAVIEKLPEFTSLLSLISSEEEFENLTIDAAGAPVSEDVRHRWLSEFVLFAFVRFFVEIKPDASWDEAAFDEVFADLVSQVDGEQRWTRLLAPLEHFKSELRRVPLDERTAIIALSDDVLSELFDDFGPSPIGSATVEIWDLFRWTHAIEHTAAREFAPVGTTRAAIPDALTALRLLRNGAVSIPFTWDRDLRRSFAPGGGHLSGAGLSPSLTFGTDFVLEEADVEPLQLTFARLQAFAQEDDESRRRFELAIRRLSSGVERGSDEDRLIDYWIALETLFLSDGPAGKYKARTRIARFLSDSFEDRVRLSRILGDSYSRRSEIVHGDRPKPDLAYLTAETGSILRETLGRLLAREGEVDVLRADLA